MKNMWGPGQDIIIGKMGGRAERTNVAAGMSGSPVYIDGKLIGAVALRLSTFSPDAICGITPIEYMLEINELDRLAPVATPRRRTAPPASQARRTFGDLSIASSPPALAGSSSPIALMVPVESPLAFNGFTDDTLRQFAPTLPAAGHSQRSPPDRAAPCAVPNPPPIGRPRCSPANPSRASSSPAT